MPELIHRSRFLRKLLLLDRDEAVPKERRSMGPRKTIRFLRPPGALMEPAFLAACTRCGECVGACPPGIIALARDTWMGVDTPVVDLSLGPCDHCGKCIEACPDGALLPDEEQRMGTAILRDSCLSLNAPECRACMEACPLSGRAIRIAAGGGGIEIVVEECTGCGLCLPACPTDPVSIRIQGRPSVPLEGHPRVPARNEG